MTTIDRITQLQKHHDALNTMILEYRLDPLELVKCLDTLLKLHMIITDAEAIRSSTIDRF